MSATIARHTIFQNSLMTALLDGIYDGELTIGDILSKGNFGLGTFDALDGEMLILDGVCHQLTSDGKARVADLGFRTPAYAKGIGVPGCHVHFINDDHSRGGHVLDYTVDEAVIELCPGTDMDLHLPVTAEFLGGRLSPEDLDEQLHSTEVKG